MDVIYEYNTPSRSFLFLNKLGSEPYAAQGEGENSPTPESVLFYVRPEDRDEIRKAAADSLAKD
nr:hypothetical protein [Desulfobacterales bacterium]